MNPIWLNAIRAAGAIRPAFYDTFADTDAVSLDVHTPDVDPAGTGWTERVGNWQINGNAAAEIAASGLVHATADMTAAAGLIRATLTIGDAVNRYAGLVVRYTDTNNYWGVIVGPERGGTNADVFLNLITAGSSSTPSSTRASLPAGATAEVWGYIEANRLTFGVDGVPLVFVISTTHHGATAHGIRLLNEIAGDNGQRIDSVRFDTNGLPVYIGYRLLAKTVTGIVANTDFRFVAYDAAWGAKPYRALAGDRAATFTTYLYESADGLAWSSYAGNPVFNNGDNYTAVTSAVYDGSQYVMAYTGPTGGGGEEIGIATSSDLISWTDLDFQITAGLGDVPVGITRLFSSGFYHDGTTYWLFVDEGVSNALQDFQIGLYFSTDLTTWTRHSTALEPVPGTWEGHGVGQGNVRELPGGTFEYLYWAQSESGQDSPYAIGRATAPAITGPWTRDARNPILGKLGGAVRIGTPVLFDVGSDTYMVYRRQYQATPNLRWTNDIVLYTD